MPPAYALSGGIYFAQKPNRHAVNSSYLNGLAFVIQTCNDEYMNKKTFTKVENGEYKSSNGLWITFNEFNYGHSVWIVSLKGQELFHTDTLSAAKAKINQMELAASVK